METVSDINDGESKNDGTEEQSGAAAGGEGRAWPWLLLCIAAALLVRLYVLYAEQFIDRDAVYYLDLVRQWHAGSFRDLMRDDPQLYVLPMAYFLFKEAMRLGVDSLTAAYIVNIGLGTALVPLMYGCGKEIFASRGMGLLAALLTAFNPLLVDLSVQILRDVAMLFGLAVALWCAVKGERKSWGWWFPAGIGVAFAVLSRYEAAEALPLAGVYLGVDWLTGGGGLRQAAGKIGCLVLGTLVGLVVFSAVMGVPWEFYSVNFLNKAKAYL